MAKRKKVHLTVDEWRQARDLYVQGVESDTGKRVHPTLETLAADLGVGIRTLENRSSADGWVKQREDFETKLRAEVDAKKRKTLAAQLIDFDSRALNLATAVLGQIGRIINNAETRRQAAQEDRMVRFIRNSEIVEELVLAKPDMDPLSPTSLTMLANAVSASQRVGRLALGEYTDSTKVTDERADDDLASAIADLFQLEGDIKKNSRKPH